MTFDILTIFPEFFTGPLDHGVLRKAREAGLVQVRVHNLRDYTEGRRQVTDDRPFGGGEGMVMKPEPIFAAVESLYGERRGPAQRVVLLSPQGRVLNQMHAARLSECEQVLLICGRYEGVDERIAEHAADEELSIGDYVLSGGELAAAVVIDVVSRLRPGVLGHELSAVQESFINAAATAAAGTSVSGNGILDCPHYTRPADFRGWQVPDVLLSGHHEQVRRWRRKKALEKTLRNRPDLLERAALANEDRALLVEIANESRPDRTGVEKRGSS